MRVLLFATLLTCTASLLPAQTVENPGFADGKSGWIGDGKIVFIDATGAVSETETPGSTKALKVELSKNKWKEISQKLRPKADETAVKISFQAMAEPGFEKLKESKDYSDVDFKVGGWAVWSALVYPKCDLLVRVKDGSWHYRPKSLSPVGTWKKFSESIEDLKERQREVALLFPPGEGTVLIRAN